MTGKQLEAELGRSEAIGAFVSECEVIINQIDPTLDYRRADLDGFVRGCWPPDDEPAEVAAQFVNSLADTCPVCKGDPSLACPRCAGYSQDLIDLDDEDGEFD